MNDEIKLADQSAEEFYIAEEDEGIIETPIPCEQVDPEFCELYRWFCNEFLPQQRHDELMTKLIIIGLATEIL